MARKVFVTGGTGFVGSRLIAALSRRGTPVVALDRSGRLRAMQATAAAGATPLDIIQADLLDPEAYRLALASCDVVVHLAAATGKAAPDDHVRVNAVGTETLLEASEQAGVGAFLFVSSIAASFPDIKRYPYAQAKLRAEAAVRRSRLRWTILRPTMILGDGSPIQAALAKLAGLPMIPVFGRGRTRVQPVAVDDVVGFITAVLDGDLFGGEVLDIGGPDVVSIEALMQRIRSSRTGRDGRTLHLPLGLVLPPLIAAEAAGLGRVLPLTVGQLATFRFDGVVSPNALFERRRPTLQSLDHMLAPPPAGPRRAQGVGARPHAILETELAREAKVFTRHLIGIPADDYVVRKYTEAHSVSDAFAPDVGFDAFLIRAACAHRLIAKAADGYARLLQPTGTLRRKLVLLLAILETSPGAYERIDRAVGGPAAVVWTRLVIHGALAVGAALAGALVFVPARVLLGLAGGRATR